MSNSNFKLLIKGTEGLIFNQLKNKAIKGTENKGDEVIKGTEGLIKGTEGLIFNQLISHSNSLINGA